MAAVVDGPAQLDRDPGRRTAGAMMTVAPEVRPNKQIDRNDRTEVGPHGGSAACAYKISHDDGHRVVQLLVKGAKQNGQSRQQRLGWGLP